MSLNCWSGLKNGRYLSHDVINELINMIGKAVLRSLVADLHKKSQLFTLIADESTDISNKEQLTCVLRWMSTSDLSVHEDFLGMYEPKKTDAEAITTSLNDYFAEMQFDYRQLSLANI